jgi:L-fuconolactonase
VDPTGEIGRAKFEAGAFNFLFAACQKYDRPLFCSAYGSTDLVGRAAKTYTDLRLVVDHMGIAQPPLNPRSAEPWGDLDILLQLAAFPNVYVKLSGVPVLSNRGFPFADVWPHVHRILDAFGIHRVMWGSDVGRFQGRLGWDNQFEIAQQPYPGKHNYAEALRFVLDTDQISAWEKEQLLGGTICRFTGWTLESLTKSNSIQVLNVWREAVALSGDQL